MSTTGTQSKLSTCCFLSFSLFSSCQNKEPLISQGLISQSRGELETSF